MARTSRLAFVLGLGVLAIAVRPVHADVPSPADFAACNGHAREATVTASAIPNVDDHARAARARTGGPAGSAEVVGASGVTSPNPQIHGMEMEGAKDPRYQATYRSCMRRRGF